MAIRDVLWGCPLCRRQAGLQKRNRRERCSGCGAEFRRGPGATIVARQGSGATTRTVAEWLHLLGEPVFTWHPESGVALGPETVSLQLATEERPLRHAGELLGFIEVFGPRATGTLTLFGDRLTFSPDRRNRSHHGFSWELDRITVVQPASSDLQVAVGSTVASIRFPHSSARLWTRAMVAALRQFHAARGCDVVEFQPLIRTRASAARRAG